MKKFIPYIILAVVCIGIMLFPVKTSGEYIRIEFTGNEDGILEGQECTLYYATNSADAFNDNQTVSCPIDNEKFYVEFKLDGVYNNNIKGLRIDFPAENQRFCIGGVFVKSAGILSKRYDPCYIFADENIKSKNDIPEMTCLKDGKVVYIVTQDKDPYIVFSDEVTKELTSHFSHFIVTKLVMCIIVVGCFFSFRKDIFGTDENKKEAEGEKS